MSVAPQLDHVPDLAKLLPPEDKLRLIEDLTQQLRGAPEPTPAKKPHRSFYGILAGRGPVPSAEDIDEMRREAWANFPREEFFERLVPSSIRMP